MEYGYNGYGGGYDGYDAGGGGGGGGGRREQRYGDASERGYYAPGQARRGVGAGAGAGVGAGGGYGSREGHGQQQQQQQYYQYDDGQYYGQQQQYPGPLQQRQYEYPVPPAHGSHTHAPSPRSGVPLTAGAAVGVGVGAAAASSSTTSIPHPLGIPSPYSDDPYKRSSTTWDPVLIKAGFSGPDDLVSPDDDDTFETQRRRAGLTPGSSASIGASAGITAAAGVAAGAASPGGAEQNNLLASTVQAEKSQFLLDEQRRKKKVKWIIAILGLLVIAGIVAGTAAGVLLSKNNSEKASSGSSSGGKGGANGGGGIELSAKEDTKVNGDLNRNSPEIKALMGNKELKKVFHGIDYTPMGTIYPECLDNPPSQNNVTRDLAIISQLTSRIRLYGNDCNQTSLIFHAIDALSIDLTVWIGVWLDSNVTTNTRQLSQLYTTLSDTTHHSKIEGIAVGNEVLFAEYMTQSELLSFISGVKSNLTTLGLDFPVGTSDLGSNWDATMAAGVDVLMANVHPFFAGVEVEKAAEWTWDFFVENDVAYTKGLKNKPRVMISEVGWPSGGGKTGGSVAGVEELNRFMEDFVCKENKRGTEYFWFSAFDEPWKVRYNEPELGKEWEDKWGLMDVNRNLKKGLVIPDCFP
ncbi:glycoside hydrolase [Ascodesmis nigricans]|uniref:glucan endo-1,3-beta-D-glucosidase n=1 Tax=Ascodesmis nigricans TaxID=341454 RepID=A0A4S2MMQ9_9PEZI|nr:glycoside hydrolase [Ascodesmis nigricans]